MGKRTASEADVVDRNATQPLTRTHAIVHTGDDARRLLLESPVPIAWHQIPERYVEPHGACHTRVRAAIPPYTKQNTPSLASHEEGDKATATIIATQDGDNQSDDTTELTMALPPLVAPRPRRLVSPNFLLFHDPLMPEDDDEQEETDTDVLHTWSQRRRAFRPIGAGRPDMGEITSPPARAMNPVVMDARFKNMQRLDLQLDARDAPLQPFHRPSAQRRGASNGVVRPIVFGKKQQKERP